MREKIGQFARGIFEYNIPQLALSEENINQGIELGTSYYGSFTISNSASSNIKGVIYSSNDMVMTNITSFSGRLNEVKYCVRSSECMSGEIIKGKFVIVTNCGEVELPYNFMIEKPVFETQLGQVKDLFQFANLAKADEVTALKLFSSPAFQTAFLAKDVKYSLIYDTLIKGKNINIAMEEFLVATHKKSPVNISVDRRKIDYVITNEEFRDKLVISKDTWGYCEVTVRTDSTFIVPAKTRIMSDDFIANRAELEFVVRSDMIRSGRSFAQIIIESIGNRIVIDICCTKSGQLGADAGNNRLKQFVSKYVSNYIDFRTEKMSLDKYISDSEVLVSNMCILTGTGINDLLKIHLMIISGRKKRATELLDLFRENLENVSLVNPIDYCGYLYLKNLLEKDEVELENAVEKTRSYYETTDHTWQMLWLLIYMDKRYDNNLRALYTDTKEQFENGCTSPVMYYEICNMFNQDNTLFEDFERFEIQVLYWGAKHDCITKNLAMHVAKLAVRLKDYNRLIFNSLTMLYEKYQTEELLTAICSMLIRGQRTNNRYFKWYKLGVEKQLKLTQLHEFYMYSYDEQSREPLPSSLLLYFSYNSSLSDAKKAFLYASIIKNKTLGFATFKNYKKIIERFMRKQIESHIINENLKVIYEEFLTPDIIDEQMAEDLPYIMFRYDICCYNPDFKGVIVANRMMENEYYAPFIDGRAQVNIYTDDSEIFLVDKDDNRYVRSNSYTAKKLLNSEMYIDKCYELNPSDDMLLLHIAKQIDMMAREDSFNVSARKRVLEIQGLRKDYQRKCQYNLIQYCHDHREVELLDAYLGQMDVDMLSPRERSYVVEYLIIRDFYEKALEAVDKYGFGIVPAKRLMKLAANLINSKYDNEQTRPLICDMCIHVFRQKKVTDEILEYMVKYFNGSTKEMFAVWRVCREKEINCTEFEERLIGQVLFAETYSMDVAQVFESYYEKGTDKRLIKAFLKYNAYKYLVKDRVIPEELFDIIAKELSFDKNEICSLAMLKYYSTKEHLDRNQKIFAEYYIEYFAGKDMVLPFFKDFVGKAYIPGYIVDKHYVEYKADPSIDISIHYQLDDTGDFVVETMKDVFMGIRVKEFLLFYGETLQYYVTEESVSGDKITESFNINANDKISDDSSRYSLINTVLMAKEMKDDVAMLEVLKEIATADYLTETLYKPFF